MFQAQKSVKLVRVLAIVLALFSNAIASADPIFTSGTQATCEGAHAAVIDSCYRQGYVGCYVWDSSTETDGSTYCRQSGSGHIEAGYRGVSGGFRRTCEAAHHAAREACHHARLHGCRVNDASTVTDGKSFCLQYAEGRE